MKLSFGNVCLVFFVTLIHIAVIALLSPVEGFEWGAETKTSEIDVLIEEALDISKDLETPGPEEARKSAGVAVEDTEEEMVEADATEPVAVSHLDELRERVSPPALAEVVREEAGLEEESEKALPPRTAGNASSANSREFRQITPIPRS